MEGKMTEIKQKNTVSDEELAYANRVIQILKQYYHRHVIGQEALGDALISSIMADGHILIESVPGLAKTTAAKAIASAVNASFSRIQCTPDLLPSDITGTQVYNRNTAQFETVFGPVFSNFVLLDEINRSSAKTQAAMLEAMQEKQVTIAGVSYHMPEDLFIVIATQNPIEQEGTYMLSEAQTDRFLIKEKLDYPDVHEEAKILRLLEKDAGKDEAVLSTEHIRTLQRICRNVYIDQAIINYIARIVSATRTPSDEMKQYIRFGASVRASIAFMKMSKAHALLSGRSYVIPEDVKAVRHNVLRHRISLSYSAVSQKIQPEDLIDQIFSGIPTP